MEEEHSSNISIFFYVCSNLTICPPRTHSHRSQHTGGGGRSPLLPAWDRFLHPEQHNLQCSLWAGLGKPSVPSAVLLPVPTPKPESNSLYSGTPGAHLFCTFINTVSTMRYFHLCNLRVGKPLWSTTATAMHKKLHHPVKQWQPSLDRAAFHPGNTFSLGVLHIFP